MSSVYTVPVTDNDINELVHPDVLPEQDLRVVDLVLSQDHPRLNTVVHSFVRSFVWLVVRSFI